MEKNERKNAYIQSKSMRKFLLIFFAALIIVADLALLFFHGNKFSENENRMLEQSPKLTEESIISGEFMSDMEDFVADQFLLRNIWISLKLSLDKLMGRKESNNIYLGKNDYLFEKPVEADEENLSKNIEAIRKFAGDTGLNIVMTLIPSAITICDQYAPDNAPVLDETATLEDIESRLGSYVAFIDVSDELKMHKEEEIYYKSDHHWKSLGAKYAFEALAPHLGITDPVRDYAVMRVTDSFTGTLGSNSGSSNIKDSIDIYIPLLGDSIDPQDSAKDRALSTELSYVVEYVSEIEKSATIYKSEALEQKDKYQVFLGGNHPLVRITTNINNGKKLLLLKDSYANTFVQFILPYYETIDIVDPRYYSGDISKLISEDEINQVLILYSENNFVTDNSLHGVLEEY